MAGYNFAALTDAELAYFVRQVNKKTVREAQPVWKAATGAGNTPGDRHIPVVCYFLWNAVGGAGRVQQDVDDANTIYNRKRIFIQPVFIRQLTRADVEAALGHRLDDRFFLDFRGVDSGADEHTHGGGKKKKPKFTDSDTEKIVKRYIPQNVVGGLWVGDMVADAGRSPGKSNDASEKWLVVNTAPAVNRTIFAHELGHLAFDSAHPVQQEEDQPGQQFTQDLPVNPATLTDDRLSLHLKYNVLTSGGLMDQFWSFAPPTPADVHVSPGQADKAKASPRAFVNP